MLHSEGAEFLVLGQLLIRGVHASKAYTRYPGWDVLAASPDTGRTCRIQVKARLRTDYDRGFTIKNFDAEFVVHVALNRSYMRLRSGDDGERPVAYYVLPMAVVKKAAMDDPRKWGESHKVFLRRIPASEQYLDAWDLIVNYLDSAPRHSRRPS